MSCTSKGRRPRVRRAASRALAKASGSRSSSVSPLAEALAELGGLGADAGVVERLELRLQRVDRLDQRAGGLDPAVVRRAEDLLRDRAQSHHETLVLKSCAGPSRPHRRPPDPPICHDGGACSPAPNGLSVREARAALLRPARDVSGCAAPVNGGPERARRAEFSARARAAREREIDMRSLLTAGLVAGHRRLGLARTLRRRTKAYDAATVRRHRQRHRHHPRPCDRACATGCRRSTRTCPTTC